MFFPRPGVIESGSVSKINNNQQYKKAVYKGVQPQNKMQICGEQSMKPTVKVIYLWLSNLGFKSNTHLI